MSPTSYLAAPPRGEPSSLPTRGRRRRVGFAPTSATTGASGRPRTRPRLPLRRTCDELPQPLGVAGGEDLPVVVEVGEDLGRLAQAAHARRPLPELAVGVVAPVAAAAVVEPEVGPVCREHLGGRLAPARVVDDEGRAVVAQQRVDRLGEPAGVAQLERMAATREV